MLYIALIASFIATGAALRWLGISVARPEDIARAQLNLDPQNHSWWILFMLGTACYACAVVAGLYWAWVSV